MTVKRLLVGILCMGCVFLFPMHSYASESSTTILTTTVPDHHMIELRIEDHGALEVDGREYRGVMQLRGKRTAQITYKVKPDEGWEIASLTYGNQQVDVDPDTFIFTAPALTEDGIVLYVTFQEVSAYSETTDKEDGKIKDTSMFIQKTGVCTVILLSGILLLFVQRRKSKAHY